MFVYECWIINELFKYSNNIEIYSKLNSFKFLKIYTWNQVVRWP